MSGALLEARGLHIAVGARSLVEGFNLSVWPGQRWCLLGPNGAGKTCLIETLAGLQRPTAGVVRYAGDDLGSIGVRAAARRRALLPQHSHDAFDASVFELACSGRHPHLAPGGWESAQDHALVMAALADFELAGLARRAVASLSGGERQRLALAAVLAQQAPLLLLDEPLNHLDLRQQQRVLATLLRIASERACGLVYSLHDLTQAQATATHAILLDGLGGHCIGTTSEVLTRTRLEHAFAVPLQSVLHQGRSYWLPAAIP